ncbi:MAG: YdbL family protein [Sneathiella sp.]|nr:YdbL family protein [Sneathiella sp.]
MRKATLNNTLSRRLVLKSAAALVVASGMMMSGPAFADQLDDLRVSGAVGEAYDGYARARAESASEFVKSINAQRRKIYIERARKQGVSVDQIGQIYAGQIKKKVPSGTWLLSSDGQWSQK